MWHSKEEDDRAMRIAFGIFIAILAGLIVVMFVTIFGIEDADAHPRRGWGNHHVGAWYGPRVYRPSACRAKANHRLPHCTTPM